MVSIIPLSIAQRRLDTGNAAQYPQGSPIGGAMQGLGDQFSAIAERYQQMKDQQEAFDAELARRRFNGRIAQAEDEAAANAPPDGGGLHETMYGQVDPRNGQVVKSGLFDMLFDDALPGMPESQRINFARQKEAMRAVGARRMAVRQLQQRKDYEQAQVDMALKTSAIAIGNANPDDHITFEAARQEGLDLIDKMGLDPGIRQQKVKDWFGTAAKTRFEALIAKDPKRALEMFGVGTPTSGSNAFGDTAQAESSSFSGSPNMAGGKNDRVGKQTPDERIAQAFRDDLPQQEQEALALKAKVAKFTQDIETRVAIGRAEAEAPDEIARTGAYPGGMPGRDAYRTIYGLDEGDKRWQGFEWQTDVGKKIFDMGTMSNQAVHAALRDADAGPDTSQEDQARRAATAVAAKLVLERRRADSGGYVGELSPNISAGWKAVFGTGPSDPAAFDQDNYDKTLALSVASQKALGIDDENLQPVPFSILRKLAEDRDSGSMYFVDNYAKASALFARTKDPVARAALVRELDDAGLGGILPGGKPGLSVGEVLLADTKALGKTAANAGIALANANDWVAYGMSGGTIGPPDYRDAYYEPENNVERVMMRQGNDALGWAIPVPGVGRAVESAIPRAIESVGARAAGRAEGPIGSSEAAHIPTSKAVSGQVTLEKIGEVRPASGEDAATDGIAKPTVKAWLPASSVSTDVLPLKIERPRGFNLDVWTAPMADARQRVAQFARMMFAGKTVVNIGDGSQVLIPWRSLKKSIVSGSGRTTRAALAAALKLDDLIASARFIETVPDRKLRADILKTHHYERAITMDGHEAVIHIVVREHRDGRRYYDHFSVESR